jgi:hypothetical protein
MGRRMRGVVATLDAALDARTPLPDALVASAQQLYTWRDVEAELLELLTDSAHDELLAVRAGEAPRLMVFGSGDQAVQLEVVRRSDGYHLHGFVSSASTGQHVRAEWSSGSLDSAADAGGAFSLAPVPAGRVRVTIEGGDQAGPLVTPWFELDRA